MKTSPLLVLAVLLVPVATTAVAVTPAQMIKVRHHNFEAMGRAMKGLFNELRKPAPNFAVFKANTAVLVNAAPRIANHFPKGSGPDAGLKTEALPAIWARPAEFSAAANRLVGTTQVLQAAVAGGDAVKVKMAAGEVGGACKNCHDSFRKPRG